MPLTSKQMVKILKKNGFVPIAQEGSHLKMQNPINKKQVTIPMHNRDLSKGTEQKILKDAGIK